MPTILPPSPPSSVGKNPWVKKPSSTSSSISSNSSPMTTLSKNDNRIGGFISFLFASWATVMSLSSPDESNESSLSSTDVLNHHHTRLLTPPNSSSSSTSSKRRLSQSTNNNMLTTTNHTTIVATTKTRKLLPTVAHHCLDIVLLASAMFITMIHYLTGDLDDEPKPIQHQYHHSASYHQQYHQYQYGRKKKIITPPSQSTIMDIKQLREWQRQQQLEEEDNNRYLLLAQLDNYHHQQQQLLSPMDDQKQQRILAWATHQNYNGSNNNNNTNDHHRHKDNDHNTYHGNTMFPQNMDKSPLFMEELDDDERYTFDDNWSVDEPMVASHINSQYLHPGSNQTITTSSYPSSYASSNQSSHHYGNNHHLHSINKLQKKIQDQKLNMMQNQVTSLIQEGQAALTKKVKVYELDPNEILMRRTLKLQKQQRLQQK
ncbi:unnamed protein product [Cunninghamella blakesleeana]